MSVVLMSKRELNRIDILARLDGSRPARRGRRRCDSDVSAATAPATSELPSDILTLQSKILAYLLWAFIHADCLVGP
jgi:hypothetical protein